MLKSAFPKLWLRAVNCIKVNVSPKPSFGLRVRCLSGFTGRGGVEAKSNGPLTVQQAGYNRFADSHLESNHQGGQESYGGSNFGGQESNADRQTLMHSVTWPQEIRNLAAELPSDAVLLTVGSTELAVIHNITQHVEVVEENMKKARFYEVLTQIIEQPDHKTLVFVQTKRLANSLALKMSRIGFPALRLHGDLSQKERDWTMNEFRSGRAKLLVLLILPLLGR
uniref:Helicase C-terminal domain-containing protein n=1 Tax=Ditylenchus dipsaci TaxID=166011 RepID=A0A915DRU5_9BILA